jgi:transcriptional regulator PpsR
MSKIVSSAADIAIVLDKKGIVKDVAFGSDELSRAGLGSWVGLKWKDTVTTESQHKISEIIEQASQDAPTAWRHVNHPRAEGGDDVPVRYSALRVKSDGKIVAFGRDLRAVAALQQQLLDAQMSIERDYAKLRQTELRYRLLFQIASEPIIIADASNGQITEINPAALALFGGSARKLSSQHLGGLFAAEDLSSVQDLLAMIRTTGKAGGIQVHIPGDTGTVSLSASFFRQGSQSFILCRIIPRSQAFEGDGGKARAALARIVDNFPDGFVVTDLKGRVLTVNDAFLDLAQLSSEDQAHGQSFDNWLGRSGVDLNVLMSALKEHGSVRNFSTVVRGQYGSAEDIEVSAVAVLDGEPPCFGFVLRPSIQPIAKFGRLPRSMENLKELVGRVALKDLVRETSDMIEKLYIEAALELTGDNRASAAEMLGLSRQSLYVKLRRYGLGDLATNEQD